MSSAKFTAMTSSLLARKGDAAPSITALPPRMPFIGFKDAFAHRAQPSLPPRPDLRMDEMRETSAPCCEPDDSAKPRRIMVTVTDRELEKLAIAAIKKGLTRHEIVRAALDAYFHRLAAELPRKCTCMTDGPCCS